MKHDFEKIFDAFEFVSAGHGFGDHAAYLDLDTGKIYFSSEYSDINELPEDTDEVNYIEIPHKNELDLGKQLVFDFVRKYIPDEMDYVGSVFSRKGAYSRFKDLLDRRDLLDDWYEFELKEQDKKLRKWCEENSIELDE